MIESFRYRARTLIGRNPWLFFPVYRLDGRRRPLMVNRDTELVIEGFPRSGNSFVVLGFEAAQGRKVRVAHHQHAPSQIKRGVSMKIPVCVLIRRPMDAVRSLSVMFPGVSFELGLSTYRDFYEDIYGLRESFVIATFE